LLAGIQVVVFAAWIISAGMGIVADRKPKVVEVRNYEDFEGGAALIAIEKKFVRMG
jgi:hypothetical protein